MADRFASVEAMLRWQAAALRETIAGGIDRLAALGELYPLPKPTDGLPEGWAFGSMTSDHVSKAHTRESLHFAMQSVEKAEAATDAGDFPTAIHWLMTAQQQERSAWTHWTGAASIRIWRYVRAGRLKLAKFAAKGNRLRTKYTTTQKDQWRADWVVLKMNGRTMRDAARIIARRYGIPGAEESIRKELGSGSETG